MGYPWFSIPCQGWPEWLGIGGRIKSESVAGLCRNGWPEWLGILSIEKRDGPVGLSRFLLG